jgi:hypothetical protein
MPDLADGVACCQITGCPRCRHVAIGAALGQAIQGRDPPLRPVRHGLLVGIPDVPAVFSAMRSPSRG